MKLYQIKLDRAWRWGWYGSCAGFTFPNVSHQIGRVALTTHVLFKNQVKFKALKQHGKVVKWLQIIFNSFSLQNNGSCGKRVRNFHHSWVVPIISLNFPLKIPHQQCNCPLHCFPSTPDGRQRALKRIIMWHSIKCSQQSPERDCGVGAAQHHF